MKRKIAAILAADVAGYSRLVAEDEEEALQRLSASRDVFEEFVSRAGGRIFNNAGDAVLAEFPSAVNALRAAILVQDALKTSNLALPENRQMQFRIGMTIGDVVENGTDLLGDGVNIAARLQGLAQPGGICISEAMHDAVHGKIPASFVSMGPQHLKNIPNAVRTYRVAVDTGHQAAASTPQSQRDAGLLGRYFPLAVGIATAAGAAIVFLISQPTKLPNPPSPVSAPVQADKPVEPNAAAPTKPAATQEAANAGTEPEPAQSSAADDSKIDRPSDIPVEQQEPPPSNADEASEAARDARTAVLPSFDSDTAAAQRLRKINWNACTADDAQLAINACRALIADGITGSALSRAHRGLAVALRRTGNIDDAIASFSKSIELETSAEALNERGIAYLHKNMINDAIADFDHAIKLDDKLGDAFNNRAWTLFKIGRRQEALRDANRAVALIPDNANVWDTRGSIQEALGNTRAAVADYEKAISLDPSQESSKMALTRLKSQ